KSRLNTRERKVLHGAHCSEGERMSVLERVPSAFEIRDDSGRVVAPVPAPTEEQIIERIGRDRSANVARYPAAQVEKRLRRLEQIRQQQGMDGLTMRDLRRRMRAGKKYDPVPGRMDFDRRSSARRHLAACS